MRDYLDQIDDKGSFTMRSAQDEINPVLAQQAAKWIGRDSGSYSGALSIAGEYTDRMADGTTTNKSNILDTVVDPVLQEQAIRWVEIGNQNKVSQSGANSIARDYISHIDDGGQITKATACDTVKEKTGKKIC
jgi:hypothetical protein